MSIVRKIEIQNFSLWEKKAAQPRALYSFDLELTARCSHNCRHCYINLPANDVAAKAQELTIAEIESIAGQAVELGAVWVLLTGGEPLLRRDFAEIYLMLKRMGLLVSVFTNATLVNPAHIELFKQYPPRDIEVTLYGGSQESYEAVTRLAGSYAAFQRGVQLLFDAGVRIRLKAMGLRSNLHEIDAMAAFGKKYTKDYYRYDPVLHLRFLSTCRTCPIVNLCLWCPAHAHLETGAMDGETPYFCQVAHARAKALQAAVKGQRQG